MRWAQLSLTILLSSAASPAWAQLDDSEWSGPRGAGLQGPLNHLAVDLRFSSQALSPTQTHLVLAPILHGWFEVAEGTALQAELPLLYNRRSSALESESGVRFGNPYLAVHRRFASGAAYARVGVGVGLPLARVDGNTFLGVLGYSRALAMDGLYDTWRWLPGTLAVTVPFRFEAPLGEQLSLAADGALMGLVGTDERSESTYAANLALEATYRVGDHAFGARLQVAALDVDGDSTQVSLVPFARIDLGSSFVNLRFLINLDEPAGFSFDQGRVWGLSAGLGFYL